MGHPCGHVHHINEDRLDCRRANLQVLSPADHRSKHPVPTGPRGPHTNSPRQVPNRTPAPQRGRSGYKGVSWSKTQEGWIAKATHEGKVHYLGCFIDKGAAAVVYDNFVLACRPKGSYTNLVPADNQQKE